jgi:hypothetical protein
MSSHIFDVGIIYGDPFRGKPHRGFKRPTTRDDGPSPNGILSINPIWGALKKCWLGYRIAFSREKDMERATLYAKRIRKLQYDLGIPITEFPHLGLVGRSPYDVDLFCD